ncbi:hypothetical protein [Rhizobium metallidurans]|uniref:Uncharacterized protein YciW n=1 Tax=Rhizobium metallidurans TaxID=1265931 RepID=A0A7W6G9P3_9HYPH|nr:uncharacterized protein YciW [Rhizobium metallidurans]
MTDAMDKIAGLAPDDPIYAARRLRPEFVEGAELCRVAVLHPANGHGIDTGLRLSLAHRMAVLNADQSLIKDYGDQLSEIGASEELMALARGATDLAEPLATIARHVDLVTLTPIDAAASDIARLQSAGLTNPQIVALSELIAFVNFQTRVASGLRLMRSA